VSAALDETDDCYFSMETGTDCGSDREARRQVRFEVNDQSGKAGIV